MLKHAYLAIPYKTKMSQEEIQIEYSLQNLLGEPIENKADHSGKVIEVFKNGDKFEGTLENGVKLIREGKAMADISIKTELPMMVSLKMICSMESGNSFIGMVLTILVSLWTTRNKERDCFFIPIEIDIQGSGKTIESMGKGVISSTRQ